MCRCVEEEEEEPTHGEGEQNRTEQNREEKPIHAR
jgi:hypothetical protein